ncbi:hypothetical protein TNCV_5122731 [Trichonephila clavipes]|nr:hypothetical protein TNCV_5122731 [Trichonephila clavipes]
MIQLPEGLMRLDTMREYQSFQLLKVPVGVLVFVMFNGAQKIESEYCLLGGNMLNILTELHIFKEFHLDPLGFMASVDIEHTKLINNWNRIDDID